MPQTPSQTVGPFFAYGLCPEQYAYDFTDLVDNQLVDPTTHPDPIMVVGKIYDGNNETIPDAMVELWQNDGENKLFGRFGTGTDSENRFIFHTIKPKSVNGQAPFINVILFMRGQLIHSYTRLYFEDEGELNATDEVLNQVPEDRRKTLIAKKQGSVYELDIYMQGDRETVFFDL